MNIFNRVIISALVLCVCGMVSNWVLHRQDTIAHLVVIIIIGIIICGIIEDARK